HFEKIEAGRGTGCPPETKQSCPRRHASWLGDHDMDRAWHHRGGERREATRLAVQLDRLDRIGLDPDLPTAREPHQRVGRAEHGPDALAEAVRLQHDDIEQAVVGRIPARSRTNGGMTSPQLATRTIAAWAS